MNIHVSRHAIDMYRSRRANARGIAAVDADIKEMVSKVVSEGRVLNHRPNDFLLFGRSKSTKPLAPGQWFAPCGDIGFILKREGKTWIVVTMLTRAGVRVAS